MGLVADKANSSADVVQGRSVMFTGGKRVLQKNDRVGQVTTPIEKFDKYDTLFDEPRYYEGDTSS